MSANHFDQTALAVSKAVTITGGTTAVIGGLTLFDVLPALKDGDSHCWRSTSRAENV